eukprot:3313591-Pleurochrysis_carterae.AAC.4
MKASHFSLKGRQADATSQPKGARNEEERVQRVLRCSQHRACGVRAPAAIRTARTCASARSAGSSARSRREAACTDMQRYVTRAAAATWGVGWGQHGRACVRDCVGINQGVGVGVGVGFNLGVWSRRFERDLWFGPWGCSSVCVCGWRHAHLQAYLQASTLLNKEENVGPCVGVTMGAAAKCDESSKHGNDA